MTIVSDDSSWWPVIRANIIFSHFTVVCFATAVYDWALTSGQEIELIWKQRWSLMTVLYLSVRYMGMIYTLIEILSIFPVGTDLGCIILVSSEDWIPVITNIMLSVIMIARLHAMYQQSRKILSFLILAALSVTIIALVVTIQYTTSMTGEELILSGTYQCGYTENSTPFMNTISWILGTVWEVLALCLAVWISVKHFRELQRPSTGWAVGDCFVVLMKTHVFYFTCFVAVSCFHIVAQFPQLFVSTSTGTYIYIGFLQTATVVQMFVLGPRLILGVREYHAELIAKASAGNDTASIAFQERIHISTSSGV